MSDPTPQIVMPAGNATVETLLLEELRRSREVTEKVSVGLGDLNTQIALIRQERTHDQTELATLRASVSGLNDKVTALTTWQERQTAVQGTFGGLLNSQFLGWIVAAVAFLYSKYVM